MTRERENFEITYDNITRNSNAIERVMSGLYAKDSEDPIIRELGNIYLQSLSVQLELSRTYGDKDAIAQVERKMDTMRQTLGLKSNVDQNASYPKLTPEEIFDGMSKTYNSMDRLMSDIYSNDPNNQAALDIGEQVALGYLDVQKFFAESYLPQDSRDVVINGIESKKVALATSLATHEGMLAEPKTSPGRR